MAPFLMLLHRKGLFMDSKKKRKYLYYDRLHGTFVDVPDNLRPILEKMDRRKRYLEKDQYYQNNVFLIPAPLFYRQEYNYCNNNSFEDVLYRICADRLWEDIANVLSEEELIFLLEYYFGKPVHEKVTLYKTITYNKNKCKKKRLNSLFLCF